MRRREVIEYPFITDFVTYMTGLLVGYEFDDYLVLPWFH
jgi:hypothetical protein